MSQNGKGDIYRPKTVSDKQWTENWNLIFGTKKKLKNIKKDKNARNKTISNSN